MEQTPQVQSVAARPWLTYGRDVVRGALIGTAETVPGVSGGTVALVVGVYETAIGGISSLIAGIRRAVVDLPRGRGLSRARDAFAEVPWRVMVPLLCGMAAALVLMARLVEGWVADHPVQTKAVFFGMVLASLYVPFSMVAHAPRRAGEGGAPWGAREYALAAVAAAGAFVAVSLPPGEMTASPPVIVAAGAIAVSALVLPGLSGSFLLLTFGLYERTLSALNEREYGYLALFALGAFIGLATFVKLLQWLLTHRRRITLVALTGLVAGCLRALWPWQTDDRALLAPDDRFGGAAVLAVLGFLVVAGLIFAERRAVARWSASS
ncbi:DUF368 domain-containing protein [Streptomyces sp. NPDC002851]